MGRLALRAGRWVCACAVAQVPPLVHRAPRTGRASPWLRSRLVGRIW